MKRLNIIGLMLLTALSAMAADLKQWSDGPIAWADFRGEAVGNDSKAAFRASIYIDPVDISVDGQMKTQIFARAAMDRGDSYVDAALRTPERLRLYQLEFDLLECYRRQLQDDISQDVAANSTDEHVRHFNALYYNEVITIATETSSGTDSSKLQQWETNVRSRLDKAEMPFVPIVSPGRFSYGCYLGVGGNFTGGSINDAFSHTWIFGGGLHVGYDRAVAKFSAFYGQPKIKRLNIMDIENQQITDKYASLTNLALTVGYKIVDTRRIAITPMVGGAWNNLRWNVGNYEWDEEKSEPLLTSTQSYSITHFSWYATIDIDIKLHSRVNSTSLFGSKKREQVVSSVRISPYITRNVYDEPQPQLRGVQAGFTVAYNVDLRSLGF